MVAIAATGFGIALIITAFFVPPMGTIDPTVLTAYGETLTFAGALVGIDYHYRDTPKPPHEGGCREERKEEDNAD